MQTELHIGIDDTDSRRSGCTTYTAACLFQELESQGFYPLDFPWLVRLNPNIPWKTRGNGALSLHFAVDEKRLEDAKKTTLATVERTSDFAGKSTDPAVAFLNGPVPVALNEFTRRALHDVVSVPEARRLAGELGLETHLLKGSRGLVGAIASIGADLAQDHTFEIIAYRGRENLGTPRRVSQDSIRRMDTFHRGSTFNNVDPETGRVLVCPHGPDPVLLGIRGEDPEYLAGAFSRIEIKEPVERIMIFKTNQGTDAHLNHHSKIKTLKPHQSTMIVGTVSSAPRTIRGGHVIFRVSDDTGTIDCAAYQTTGTLRKIALQLVAGDPVGVSGGIRLGPNRMLTLNIEKLEITELVDKIRLTNPRCPNCAARCESMGQGQGFRCRKCGTKLPRTSQIKTHEQRQVRPGTYLPPVRAHRHLTKPLSRYGTERLPYSSANQVAIDQILESIAPISIPS